MRSAAPLLSSLERVQSWLHGLSAPRAALLAGLNGALTSLAMPPLCLWPLMALTMPLLLWQLDAAINKSRTAKPATDQATDQASRPASKGAAWRAPFLIGWAFGFGYFTTNLYWIGASFLVEAEKFALLMPLAVIVLPALLAIFYGAALLAASLYWPASASRLFTLALTLGAADWLRSHIFTGFPWQLLGHSLTVNDWLMQSLTLYGLYALTPLAILIFASPALLLPSGLPVVSSATPAKGTAMPLLAAALMLLALISYGGYRLHSLPGAGTEPASTYQLLLVQPGVPQTEKVSAALRPNALARIVSMTERQLASEPQGPKLIIWPETAVPYALNKSPELQAKLAALLKDGDHLVTGAFAVTGEQGAEFNVHNSLYILNHKAEIKARYDKHHLVPFGEYLPFPNLLSTIGLEALVRMRGGFTPGPMPEPLSINGAPTLMPFICYEAIFPRYMQGNNSAGWMLNISNDGWFGRTAGPYQHAHMTRLRSVETGRPMVRLANNGITSLYDGAGRTLAELPLGENGVLRVKLPAAISLPVDENGRLIIFLLTILAAFSFLRLQKCQ